MINHATEAEARYDHLDDTGLFNAGELRDRSGLEADGTSEDFPAAAIAARTGDIALSGYMDDTPVRNEKQGLNHREWGKAMSDPLQAEVHRNGVAKAREALNKAQEQA